MRAPLVPLALLVLVAGAAQGQGRVAPPLPDTTAARYGTSGSLVVVLTEYGFGAGGSARARLTDDVSFVAELSAGAGRDEREQSFIGFFGERETPFKRNYVALVPLHVGLERRLFRRSVEDNFRPFVAALVGPTLALQWPYFDDVDGDGRRDATEDLVGPLGGVDASQARVGVGGMVALGAFFGRGRRTSQAVRFGVQGTYFPVEVDLLELRPDVEEPSRQTFWTPVVSFHVARLL
ncbi:hypothetical protein [Rubrivirga sp.]|uniref:hypothetical protein n=1 Tax=Rubrivirga sp. TaxID=1885344 RepID=UPI003B515D9B